MTLHDLSRAHLPSLATVIRAGIAQTEPHYRERGADILFRGSYDWHSCVHAHWALQSMAQLDARISPPVMDWSALQQEAQYLAQNPEFETPYGRAWLVLLLSHLEAPGVHILYDTVFNQLVDWLRQNPFPEKDGALLGTHGSWLFCYFLLRLSLHGKAHAALTDLYGEKIFPLHHALETFSPEHGSDWDFIDRSALLATIDLVEGRALSSTHQTNLHRLTTNFLAHEIGALAREQSHHPGRWAMLAWPLACAGDEDATRILQKILSAPHCWRDNFAWFSHWVPQFVWMGFYLGQPKL